MGKPAKVAIYDTTLRDGSQQPGISFSEHDKLAIAQRLAQLGVDYIELGWPGSNEKEVAVFQAAKGKDFGNSKIVAFGMTCAKGKKPKDDEQLAKLLAAETEIIAIVGKSSVRHVENVLKITLEENLRLIRETCEFLTSKGRKVFFDAEHFFDGYKENAEYSLLCITAAVEGGACSIVLCDTNGGSLPDEIRAITKKAITAVNIQSAFGEEEVSVGIHVHNDGEMAVAGTLAAVEAGADQVQVTINGYGERCGNANLCSVVPTLKTKMGVDCITDEAMAQLTALARFTAEVANLALDPRQPYVGSTAFRHKAGLHASAVARDPNSYHSILPELVGNTSSVAVSELAGKSNIVAKAREFGIDLPADKVKDVLQQVEEMEHHGFQFEGADGSLKLVMMRQIGYSPSFQVLDRDVRSQRTNGANSVDSAIVKVKLSNCIVDEVAYGAGPVNALDMALRKALVPRFSFLGEVLLIDYKVRVLPGAKGTAKAVRILIDFFDGKEEWTTVGCSTDSIEASLQALVDGFEYAIFKAH